MRRVVATLLITVALLGAGWYSTSPVAAQTFRTLIDGWVIMDRVTINHDAEIKGTLTAGTLTAGTVAATGAVSAGSVAATGTVQAATVSTAFGQFTAANVLTITQGLTITPASSYQPLASAGNVSTGVIATGAAGNILMLVNTADTTITISDTGTLKLSGNLALGQFDSVTLISDGTNWVQLATSNN
jgi:hypothetical protein